MLVVALWVKDSSNHGLRNTYFIFVQQKNENRVPHFSVFSRRSGQRVNEPQGSSYASTAKSFGWIKLADVYESIKKMISAGLPGRT